MTIEISFAPGCQALELFLALVAMAGFNALVFFSNLGDSAVGRDWSFFLGGGVGGVLCAQDTEVIVGIVVVNSSLRVRQHGKWILIN